ncbi:MAG TPA: hypothetical protein PK686_01855 [bacterium]|nr:hypothetical protein [bacterium]HPV65412.1 hypothetical protein [bacterium]
MENKQKKYGLLVLSIVVFLLFILSIYLYFKGNEIQEKNVQQANQEQKSEDTNMIKNELTSEEQQTVLKYLEENISDISTEKEVLGGKFYITSLDFLDGNNAVIEYEDGHIALKAEINFQYIDENNITINKFEIIE